jgi:hypothetical protein
MGWGLVSVGSAPLTATVDDWRYVNSGTVTGTVTIPSGSSMTVTNVQTGRTTTLKNGSFSIPTGVGALRAPPPSAGSRVPMATKLRGATCEMANRGEPGRLLPTCGKRTMAAPTAASHGLRHSAATAAAETFPPTVLAEFDDKVTNVAADSPIFPTILYTGGV